METQSLIKGTSTKSLPVCPDSLLDLHPPVSALGELCAKYRSEKSFHGYDPSVLKSGIQKYVRRADVDKGLWCLIELDLFGLLECDGDVLDEYLKNHPGESLTKVQRSAQRIRSNMINRLIVMMSEEVNISAWWLPVVMWDLYQKWHINRKDSISRKFLMDMCLHLTSQKMIRLVSDIISVYRVPPDNEKTSKTGDYRRIHKEVMLRYPNVCANQAAVGKVDWIIDSSGYPANLKSFIDGIVFNLEQGSDNVFFWIRELYEVARINKVKESKYTNLLWKLLYGFIDQYSEWERIRGPITALHTFYKEMKHREKPIYLIHAVLLIVRRMEIDWYSSPPVIDTPSVEIDKLYDEHICNGKIEMDDFVMDMHTRGGRRAANRLEKFALEGAYVKNEDVKFLNPDYREIYVELKKELDRHRCKKGRVS